MTLADAHGNTARSVIAEVEAAAIERLGVEFALSRAALQDGGDPTEQRLIVRSWTDWYRDALRQPECGISGSNISVGLSSVIPSRSPDARPKTVCKSQRL